jgi:hypothetical protein
MFVVLRCALALAFGPALISAHAQPLLPALVQATTVDAAMNAVGATKALENSRLALEFEEITLQGPFKIEGRSEIPGTSAMVLMVGAPAAWYGSNVPGTSPPRTAPASAANAPKPAVVLAWQVPPGKKPILRTTYPQLDQRQAFTLLVLAQGRWFVTVREAKLACEPGRSCQTGKPALPSARKSSRGLIPGAP